jgi:phosphatidylglycerophosphatase A
MKKTGLNWNFWIATGFGVGKSPIIPGTCGSLLTFPLLFGLAMLLPGIEQLNHYIYSVYTPVFYVSSVVLIFAIISYLLGLWALPGYLYQHDDADPKEVVIDEIAGQALTLAGTMPVAVLLAHDRTILWLVLIGSFITFRLCDMLKPWPVNWVDQNVKGPMGIMLDDVVAAIMAMLLFYALFFIAIDYQLLNVQ